jgi:mono/diheme cytochrome c family protein
MLFAASTQRAVGWVILAIVLIGFVWYAVANVRGGRKSIGSEIELAPNRKPYYDDAILETTRLDRSLLMGLGFLIVIGLALPFYWLGEPGRHDGAQAGEAQKSINKGEALFVSFCSNCHAAGGVGGAAAPTITDDSGNFVATVSWKAPALTTVFYKFDQSEITQILTYGRNGVMPAWGLAGGGALNDGQIISLENYLRSIQIPEKDVQDQVVAGVKAGIKADVLVSDVDLAAQLKAANALTNADAKASAVKTANDSIAARVDTIYARVSNKDATESDKLYYGSLLFSNPADQGALNCARCHTKGWSYDADQPQVNSKSGGPLVSRLIPGGGFFGPTLTGGATVRKFRTPALQEAFISEGSVLGKNYGSSGSGGDGDGMMPGFGPRPDTAAPDGKQYPGILTAEQISAIVAYERSL